MDNVSNENKSELGGNKTHESNKSDKNSKTVNEISVKGRESGITTNIGNVTPFAQMLMTGFNSSLK